MMTYMKQFMSSGKDITHHIEWHLLFRLCKIFIYWPPVVYFVLAKREGGRGIANVRFCQDRVIKFIWDSLAHLCRTHLSSYVMYTLCYIDKNFLLPIPFFPLSSSSVSDVATLHPNVSFHLHASSQSFFSVISFHLLPLFCVTHFLVCCSDLNLSFSFQLFVFIACI